MDNFIIEKLKISNIGKRYWNAEIDFIKDVILKDKVCQYVGDIKTNLEESCNIVLLGCYGGGKTSISVIIAKALFELKKSVYFLPIFELNEIFFRRKEDEYKEIYHRLRNVDLLILDDLDSQYENDFSMTLLESLIRYRYNNMKLNIYTINNLMSLTLNGGVIDIIKQDSLLINMPDVNHRRSNDKPTIDNKEIDIEDIDNIKIEK